MIKCISPQDVQLDKKRDKLIASMKTTAINRYNASNRLAWQSKVTFLVSTLFSLGLIFIPLMQLAKAPLKLNGEILNAIQIFLAVAILVYSVKTGTSRFELRSEQLNDCGDKIKSLIRELRTIPPTDDNAETELLKNIQKKYEAIIADVENHERSDYILTILRSPDIFSLEIPGTIYHWVKYFFLSIIPYLPAIIFVTIEITLITDMFGATRIFLPFLSKNICQ